MEKREPAKTPAKDVRAWQHRDDQDKNEQTEFPFDWPNESSTETDQPRQQGDRRDQTARHFRRRVRERARGKIRPVHRPAGKNERRQGRGRHEPLEMRRTFLRLARGAMNVIEEREPRRSGETQAEKQSGRERPKRRKLPRFA